MTRLLLCLLLATVLCLPAWSRGELIGSAGAEVYGHAWVQQWTAAAWPAWPLGTSLALGTEHRAVIDPIPNWLFGALPLGLVTVWNLRTLLSLMLAGWGGGRLAEAFTGDRRAWGLGMVGVMSAPIFLGSVVSGLTEDLAWGLVLGALAEMWEGRPIRGGLLLGISAGCGLYLAWLGALVAGVWGLRFFGRDRRGWLTGGVLALALSAGFALPFWGRLGGEEGGVYHSQVEPLWKLNPWKGSDLASFWVPGKVDTGEAFVREHPSYLGYSSLGLALLAPVGPTWLGILGCMGVAAGPEFSLQGTPTGISNPLIPLFQRIPFGGRWHHYGRLMLLGQSLLVMLAARGAVTRPRLLPFAPFLLLAENLLLSPIPFPLPGASPESPSIYHALQSLPPGPLLVLGAAGPGIHPQRLFFDQQAHGRRLLHDPDRPGPPPSRIPPGTIVVALGTAEGPVRQDATSRFGPPQVETGDGAAWLR